MNKLQLWNIKESHLDGPSFYTGTIDSYNLSGYITLLELDFQSHENLTCYIKSGYDASVYMLVNLDSKGFISLRCQDTEVKIPGLSNLMLYFEEENILFQCEAGKKYNFIILRINLSHFEAEQKSFLNTIREDGIFAEKLNPEHSIVPNLKILETAKYLKSLNKETYCNKIIARGYANIVIGQKIKEFLNKSGHSGHTSNLRQFEIQQLQKITQEIDQHPHKQFTIADLCKNSGLSVSKLQDGFKDMHNCTVAIYIRNVRLDKALELLHDSDLNVSEIVYSIGLNSRSYFCRIFKKRFHCSPKAYQQQLKGREQQAS